MAPAYWVPAAEKFELMIAALPVFPFAVPTPAVAVTDPLPAKTTDCHEAGFELAALDTTLVAVAVGYLSIASSIKTWPLLARVSSARDARARGRIFIGEIRVQEDERGLRVSTR